MKLIIAEKPALAEAIKEAIGTDFQKKDSYYENKEYYISWCIGHLLEVMLPDENSKWSFDNLPLKHKGWNFQIKENTKKQYNIVKTLIDMSDTIIHAGDPDEEGQLIVDSILYKENIIDLKGNSKKTIKRLLVNDFNTKSIKKELSNLKDNNEYLNLSYMALARTLADKTFGYNLTRGYTLKNQEAGNNNVISIGRVQTPMLALIVRREQEIKNHVKSYYYTIKGSTAIAGSSLDFIYQTKAEEIDETKKITSEETANTIINRLNDNKSKAVVFKYETKEEIDTVPLPYNLLDLQVDCSKLYNMKADKVMSVTQDLREKHKAITYNRSDCNYLLDETYEQSPAIIACLQDINDEKLQNIVNNANIDIKSKAFNSSKTTAHTAIIPTETKLDFSAFSDDEKKVFLLIANRFVMQFLPPAKYLKHTITIKINDDYLINGKSQGKAWNGSYVGKIEANGELIFEIPVTVIDSFNNKDHESNTILNKANLKVKDLLTEKYGNEIDTEEIVHYLEPAIGYTMTKERITDPDKGLDGFYAGTGQVIDYKVTLVNTGDITLDIDLEDVFVNAEYFEFVDTNKASVSIEPEETREVIFKATIKAGTPANVNYKNIVTSIAQGWYVNAKTGERVIVNQDNWPDAVTTAKVEDDAITPVITPGVKPIEPTKSGVETSDNSSVALFGSLTKISGLALVLRRKKED